MNVYTIDTAILINCLNNAGNLQKINYYQNNVEMLKNAIFYAKKELIRFINQELLVDSNSQVVIPIGMNTNANIKNEKFKNRRYNNDTIKPFKYIIDKVNKFPLRNVNSFLQYFVTNIAFNNKCGYLILMLGKMLDMHYENNNRVHVIHTEDFSDKDIYKILAPFSLFPAISFKHYFITLSNRISAYQSTEYIFSDFMIFKLEKDCFELTLPKNVIMPTKVKFEDNFSNLLSLNNNLLPTDASEEEKSRIIEQYCNIIKNPSEIKMEYIRNSTEKVYRLSIEKFHRTIIKNHQLNCETMKSLFPAVTLNQYLLVLTLDGQTPKSNLATVVTKLSKNIGISIRVTQNELNKLSFNKELLRYCSYIYRECEKMYSKI